MNVITKYVGQIFIGVLVGVFIIMIGLMLLEVMNEELVVCNEVCSSIHNRTMNYFDAKELCNGFTIEMYDKCYKEGIIEWEALS